ncbi:hypothetical protein [Streptomyces sp. TRM68416]|uniref:hypothetical protein n=1 Tax=Streptomyces sp. TRM68416 TaxID=2758412 RepID=UPI0016619841|nr:hypothetical protein [Streptomyces sp. TRM68416]MBD0838176.1 hypothetical protein [Streptomyces sp. TRM68416]
MFTYTTVNPWPSLRMFAKFACIAEQYGYRYDGLDPDMSGSSTPFFVFRRLPDARARAERTRSRYPDALSGGRLPGMRRRWFPGPASPEARHEVRILRARIAIDHFSVVGGQRLRPWLIRIAVVAVALVVVNAQFSAAAVGTAAGLALALTVLLVGSRVFMRRRVVTYRRKLEAVGIRWPASPSGGGLPSPHDQPEVTGSTSGDSAAARARAAVMRRR